MRGMFTAGVIDVLMEHGIEVDGAVGVSAGAVFGCNYISKQIGRVIRYNKRFCRDSRYCSMRSLIQTGDMFGTEFCYHTLPEQLDLFDTKTFDESPVEFFVVCTDVETGKPVYHKCEKITPEEMDWMRASASMPLASRIVEIQGQKLLDGGIADSIPLQFMESQGYYKNLVILTQPQGYVKQKNHLMPLMRTALRKYPNVLTTMEKRHEIYNESVKFVEEEEEKGNIFLIRPEEPLPIGRIEHDPDKLQAVYDMGRKTAEKRLGKLIDFLQ